MLERRDAMGTLVRLEAPPRRVVSLVPSETETVCLLGRAEVLVGRTEYCVEPAEAVREVPTVRGTKDADVRAILALAPELVLANQEENTPELVRALREGGLTVHVSFPRTVEQAQALVHELAFFLDAQQHPALSAMDRALADATQARSQRRPVRVFCPIWMDPLMTIHGDTFLSDMLDLAGGANVFAGRTRRYPLAADLGLRPPLEASRIVGRDLRYPRITTEELVASQPDVVLLPSEPHPFTEKDADFFRSLAIPAAREGRVHFLDGKDLCWYSPRMGEGVGRVAEALHRSPR